MTLPNDPDQPTDGGDGDPVVGRPEIVEPAGTEDVVPPQSAPLAETESAPVTTPRPVPVEGTPESGGTGGKVRAAAAFAAAAAVANKIRKEAPQRVQEFRQRRDAGRCVILAEVDGRQVVVGPYRNDLAARQGLANVTGVTTIIELVSPTAYSTLQGEATTSDLPPSSLRGKGLP